MFLARHNEQVERLVRLDQRIRHLKRRRRIDVLIQLANEQQQLALQLARVDDVRRRIAGDRDLETLFEAIVVKRALERADIMNETGMSAAVYRNARRRLDRTLLELSTPAREAVMAAFLN